MRKKYIRQHHKEIRHKNKYLKTIPNSISKHLFFPSERYFFI